MSTSRLALLLHPVRMRLVNALSAGRTLTTTELCARMPDLPMATVYRQVGRLARGGVFEVESERRVRGAVERRYRLAQEGTVLDPEAVRAMSLEDHRRGFTAAMAALLGEFNTYLDRAGADPTADAVSYKQFTLWLSAAERARLIRDLRRTFLALMNNKPGAGRAPYLAGTIFFPIGPAPRKAARKSSRGQASPT
jgi:hypothetical protein